MDELPVLEALHENYKDKIEILLLTRDKGWKMEGFIKNEHKISSTVLLDTDTKIKDLYNIRGIPQAFFLDKEGKVKSKKIGYDSKKEKETLEEYKKIINGML